MAEEGKGLSPAGHHSVRLPGEERHPAAAGDRRRSGGLGGGDGRDIMRVSLLLHKLERLVQALLLLLQIRMHVQIQRRTDV